MVEATGGTVGKWTAEAAGAGSVKAAAGETTGDATARGVTEIGGKPKCS